jgi:hypothetical protein
MIEYLKCNIQELSMYNMNDKQVYTNNNHFVPIESTIFLYIDAIFLVLFDQFLQIHVLFYIFGVPRLMYVHEHVLLE